MDRIRKAVENAKAKNVDRMEKTIQAVNNNDPFLKQSSKRNSSNTDNLSKRGPNIYSYGGVTKVGLEYVHTFCDYSHSAYENVTSLSLNNKLLTNQGLSILCTYLSLGFYPHLSILMLEDNLLTDESLNILSKLIEDNMCPELSEIWLSRNYINQETGRLFLDYCTDHRIQVEFGGCPNFSFAPLLTPTQPPFLVYRVITKAEQVGSDLYSSLHFADIRTANQWSSDNAKPIVGIQIFYYGMGKMAVKMLDTTGTPFMPNGDCGELAVSKSLSPIVSMEFGYMNSSYRLVGMTNSKDGVIV
ncbi:hypothetical protein WA171_003593, partial [Blastocystis sp. BT1]